MPRELLLLRHAKSDWNQDTGDYDRPLNARGLRDAERLGSWAHEQGMHLDAVFSSPARRAEQTATALCAHIGFTPADIRWDRRLYLASQNTLLDILAETPARARSVILVGHNPGLEDLLLYLAPEAEASRHKDKLLTTATLARLRLPDDGWKPQRHSAALLEFIRPRDIPD